MKKQHDLVSVHVPLIDTGERAALVENMKGTGVWLPLSQCELTDNKDGTCNIEMPEWLAVEKEMV